MDKNKIASAPPRRGSEMRPGELREHYVSYSALLSDHLMLTMLIDRRGSLRCASLARVAEFSQETLSSVTEELVVRFGIDDDLFAVLVADRDCKLGCYGSDLRADMASCLDDLLQVEKSSPARLKDDLFDQLRDVSESA